MIVVLGAGLSGLAAGQALTTAGKKAVVIEKSPAVGGLSKTIRYNGHAFDLGGHRFLTDNKTLLSLVRDLLGDDLLKVPRKSQIYMRGKFIGYPLNPFNAVLGLGVPETIRILSDYCKEKTAARRGKREIVSLEDWVVAQFGRTMFDLYFKQYSEKVWGIACDRISKDWVAQRIDGLSLGQAVKKALCRFRGKGFRTLSDSFLYPRHGIGQLAESLRDGINEKNSVLTGTEVVEVSHHNSTLTAVRLAGPRKEEYLLRGEAYLSSIPITVLLEKLRPRPPAAVLAAAAKIRYRGLVTVTLMIDRDRATDLTWMYLPEREIPFGRIHEPKNWSACLAPAGKTHLVAEYFCSQGDATWNSSDARLTESTVAHLQRLGFIDAEEVTDSCVLRIPHAYPVFKVRYQEHLKVVTDYLQRFENLHLIGRSGMFRYLNMDHAMESGLKAVDGILHKQRKSAAALYPAKLTALSCRP